MENQIAGPRLSPSRNSNLQAGIAIRDVYIRSWPIIGIFLLLSVSTAFAAGNAPDPFSAYPGGSEQIEDWRRSLAPGAFSPMHDVVLSDEVLFSRSGQKGHMERCGSRASAVLPLLPRADTPLTTFKLQYNGQDAQIKDYIGSGYACTFPGGSGIADVSFGRDMSPVVGLIRYADGSYWLGQVKASMRPQNKGIFVFIEPLTTLIPVPAGVGEWGLTDGSRVQGTAVRQPGRHWPDKSWTGGALFAFEMQAIERGMAPGGERLSTDIRIVDGRLQGRQADLASSTTGVASREVAASAPSLAPAPAPAVTQEETPRAVAAVVPAPVAAVSASMPAQVASRPPAQTRGAVHPLIPAFPDFPDDPAHPEIAQLRALYDELTAPDWTPVHRLQAKGGIDDKVRVKGRLFCQKNLSGPAEVVFTPTDSRPAWNLKLLRVKDVACQQGYTEGLLVYGDGMMWVGNFRVNQGNLFMTAVHPNIAHRRVYYPDSIPPGDYFYGNDGKLLAQILHRPEHPGRQARLDSEGRAVIERGNIVYDRIEQPQAAATIYSAINGHLGGRQGIVGEDAHVKITLPGIGTFETNHASYGWRLGDPVRYARFESADHSYHVYGGACDVTTTCNQHRRHADLSPRRASAQATNILQPVWVKAQVSGNQRINGNNALVDAGYMAFAGQALGSNRPLMQLIETFVDTPLGPPGLYDHAGVLPLGDVNGISPVSDPQNVRPQPATLLAYAEVAAACPMKPEIPVGWQLWGPFCKTQPDVIQAYSPTRTYRLTFKRNEDVVLEEYQSTLRRYYDDSQWKVLAVAPGFVQRSGIDERPVSAGQVDQSKWPVVHAAECPAVDDPARNEPCLLLNAGQRYDAAFLARREQARLDGYLGQELADAEQARLRRNQGAKDSNASFRAQLDAEQRARARERELQREADDRSFANAMGGVIRDLQSNADRAVREVRAETQRINTARQVAETYHATQQRAAQNSPAPSRPHAPEANAFTQARASTMQRMQSAASQSLSGSGRPGAERAADSSAGSTDNDDKTYPAVPEAVAVCVVISGKPDHYRCHSPLNPGGVGVNPSQSSGYQTPEQWVAHVGNCNDRGRSHSLSDGGMYWTCGYGVTGIVKDAAQAAGAIVGNRGTFYCDAQEQYCRRRTPIGP